jgi:hypothetical protein
MDDPATPPNQPRTSADMDDPNNSDEDDDEVDEPEEEEEEGALSTAYHDVNVLG